MKITICIGSSCHVKGSREVIDIFQRMIKDNGLTKKVELAGTFCMGKCQQGICVDVDGKVFSLTPETAESFFDKEIVPKVS